MSDSDQLRPSGEKLRQAVKWIGEKAKANPKAKRIEILREAELRFDLTPLECEFLDHTLAGEAPPKPAC